MNFNYLWDTSQFEVHPMRLQNRVHLKSRYQLCPLHSVPNGYDDNSYDDDDDDDDVVDDGGGEYMCKRYEIYECAYIHMQTWFISCDNWVPRLSFSH